MKERSEGPEVTTTYSCFNCKYEVSERYRCQSDSGHDVYCTHPSFPERKRIGDTTWSTPEFCPFRKSQPLPIEGGEREEFSAEDLEAAFNAGQAYDYYIGLRTWHASAQKRPNFKEWLATRKGSKADNQ